MFPSHSSQCRPFAITDCLGPCARQKSEISWLRRLRRTCANSTVCGLVRSAQGVWQGKGGHCIPSWSAEGSQATLARFLCWPESIHPYPCLLYLSSARLANLGAKGRELRLLLVRKTCAARLASIQPFTFQGRSPLTLNSNKA